MVLAKVRTAGPSNAERIRSVVAAATSLSLTTDGSSYDLIAMHTTDRRGRLRLHPPADSPLAVQIAFAPRGVLAGLLEFTDVAPTGVRDRVRSRVTLSGWLTPCEEQPTAGALVLRLDAARAGIERRGLVEYVGLDELALAEPDVLACQEAAMLTHLDDDHHEVVEQLSRLLDPEVLQGAVRVRPLALDRHGITLRCEYPRSHADVRISFAAPVHDADGVGPQMERLLRRAAARCRKRRSGTS